jgi:GNAT superfamily N-acetyltransferase
VQIEPLKDLEVLRRFLARAGGSLKTFRYFNHRPVTITANHLRTLIGLEGDLPVSYGHLDREDGVVWLGICVAEPEKGKGYGDLMMDALLEYHGEISLGVDVDNVPAQKLYEKKGFHYVRTDRGLKFYVIEERQ